MWTRLTICTVLLAFCLIAMAGQGQEAKPPAKTDAAAAEAAAPETEATEAAKPKPKTKDKKLSGGAAFVAKVREGGWSMAVLLALSIVMVSVAVERVFRLRRNAIAPETLIEQSRELWKAQDFDALQEACQAQPSVYADIVSHLVENRTDDPALLTEEVDELGRFELSGHLMKLRPLTVVATLAPLVGLFGTVLGMIESFDKVALMGEMGDASILAGGISKALVTTAGGLVIAIPAIALYHFFRSRTEKFGKIMEQATMSLIRRGLGHRIKGTEEAA